MSEHLLKFLLSELDTVRILCGNPNCGAVVEVPLGRLRHTFRTYECPVCRQPFSLAGEEVGHNWLLKLQEAVEGLRQADRLKVQFVIPQKE